MQWLVLGIRVRVNPCLVDELAEVCVKLNIPNQNDVQEAYFAFVVRFV